MSNVNNLSGAWQLDPAVAYLNHGGYGAVPLTVTAEQDRLRQRLEANPTRFFATELAGLLADVRDRLADFFNADAAGMVFVPNATAGVQTVLTNLDLTGSSVIVATDHAYPAVRRQLDVIARRTGCTVRVVPVPLPVTDERAIVEAVLERVDRSTTALVLDHVAAPSGLVFPVAEIAAAARSNGVTVVVDGAHAAGMLPVDVAALGVDFWVGNLHKWICAPKAAAVLWSAPHWRDRLHPLVPSAYYDDGLHASFDWTGTSDPTPVLSTPAALDFFDKVGWDAVRAQNASLAARGVNVVAAALGTDVPIDEERAGAMRIADLGRVLEPDQARELERRLYDDHRIQVPVTSVRGFRWVRMSAQLYNTIDDYERLATALPKLLAELG